jgi:hypothetical protein
MTRRHLALLLRGRLRQERPNLCCVHHRPYYGINVGIRRGLPQPHKAQGL